MLSVCCWPAVFVRRCSHGNSSDKSQLRDKISEIQFYYRNNSVSGWFGTNCGRISTCLNEIEPGSNHWAPWFPYPIDPTNTNENKRGIEPCAAHYFTSDQAFCLTTCCSSRITPWSGRYTCLKCLIYSTWQASEWKPGMKNRIHRISLSATPLNGCRYLTGI